MADSIASIVNSVASASGTAPSASSGVTFTSSSDKTTLAGNFNTFLTLLTTQLKNQNPLDPLDTNQFTQQLVQFASVEQQINMNTQLISLVALQQTAQSTAALGFVGQTVTGDGHTAQLAGGRASWTFSSTKPADATMTITNATGQTVYATSQAVQSGAQTFNWNGRDAS